MLRSLCLSIVKASAVILCLGIASSACWFGAGVDSRRGESRERHEERHEEHRR